MGTVQRGCSTDVPCSHGKTDGKSLQCHPACGGHCCERTRPLPRHSSAISRRNVALLLLLALSLEQTFANLGPKFREKPGICRTDHLICKTAAPDLCHDDYDCDEKMKCCNFACGKKCMDIFQDPCLLPADQGPCNNFQKRWHYKLNLLLCQPFKYGGCHGNTNNFLSRDDCMKFCSSTVNKGTCPIFPSKGMKCSNSCYNDNDCSENEKCCESSCGFVCSGAWLVKGGLCPKEPSECGNIDIPWCVKDEDCQLAEKCCSYCGMKCMEPHQ